MSCPLTSRSPWTIGSKCLGVVPAPVEDVTVSIRRVIEREKVLAKENTKHEGECKKRQSIIVRLFVCLFIRVAFTFWQHLRSFQHGYQLVTVRTDGGESFSVSPPRDLAVSTMTRYPTVTLS